MPFIPACSHNLTMLKGQRSPTTENIQNNLPYESESKLKRKIKKKRKQNKTVSSQIPKVTTTQGQR